MRNRRPLRPNTELRFTNHVGGKMQYVVGDVIGMGGSCIVYDGYYRNNAGTKNTVRIKECYPHNLHIDRAHDGTLLIAENEIDKFENYKDRIRNSFDVANELHQAMGLTNRTSNVFDRYEANHTVYIVSSYVEGNTLTDIAFETLRDAVRVVISVAKSIDKIHNQGYLYLDVKPENILMYHETPDLIQLFDFDSVIPIGLRERLTEYKISYSAGFAPIEQKIGKMSQIGIYTDIYSVGALLFYLLFERVPKATDCGFDVEYDYTKLKWDNLYQPKVYRELTIFFQNTLQAYPPDRYQNMMDAILQLEVIEKYVDMPVTFICSGYVTNGGMVVGREAECNRILNWYEGDEKLLFVTGMGGIGKSTIVRKFVSDNTEHFDTMIYLQYRDSICETIADDIQFCMNGYEKEPEESFKEYFARKIKAAKELTADTNTLLVIDNFDGVIDEEFRELLNVNWKIIAVTRSDMSGAGYACQKVEPFSSKNELYLLFESNMGRKLKAEEYPKLDRMIEMVTGHTLVLTLIAKQIAKCFIDVDVAMKLVEEKGFSGIAPEKVHYMQDGRGYYDTISGIIKAVYDVSTLSAEKKKCMKILSLFDIPGIDVKEAKELLKLESLDDINELADLGWIEILDRNVQMHPLVQETMHQMAWTEEYREIALDKMQKLFEEIKQSDKSKSLSKALVLAKSVLLHGGKDDSLYHADAYKDLMFVTLMHLPKDQEAYILAHCEKLFRDNAYNHPQSVMELYDYVVYLQCQRENYEEAAQYLKRAKAFAEQWKEHYIWGLYYDMLSDFYDALLDGAYYTNDKKLLLATDKAIYHMRKAKHEKAKSLYVKYVLGKAALMIRSTPEKRRRIKHLISSTKRIMEQHTSEYEEVRSVYYTVWAWYYTLCEPEEKIVLQYLKQAAEINAARDISDLDEIDYYYIPAANMMCELGNVPKALELLEEACNVCDTHTDSIPYIRKKEDLLGYQSEVC